MVTSSSRGDRGSALEVFGVALRLGLTSFGGPIAHLGYFRREYVERRRWLGEAAYADLVALCQLLPGPASSEVGIAIGTQRAGYLGGVAAWLGFTLPSAIALTAFALLTSGVDLSTAGWVHGLKLAAVAVVAQAVWSMARSLAPDVPRTVIALVAAAIAIVAPAVAPLAAVQVALIVTGGVIGAAFLRREAVPLREREPVHLSRQFGAACLGLFATLLVALPLVQRALDSRPVAVFDAFFRSGGLVFGGGHVVLPLLHATVVTPGWVSDDRFLAGYGAAQAVPGPLFTFSAYLGAILAPGPNGVPGAALALGAMFLPAFLLVWGAMPFWAALRRSARLAAALRGTNAVVVGILLAALYDPIAVSAIHAPTDLGLAVVGLALLASRRVPPIVVVILAAAAGQFLAGFLGPP